MALLDYQQFIAAIGNYVRTLKTRDEVFIFIRAIKGKTVKQSYVWILQQQMAQINAQKADLQAIIDAAVNIPD